MAEDGDLQPVPQAASARDSPSGLRGFARRLKEFLGVVPWEEALADG